MNSIIVNLKKLPVWLAKAFIYTSIALVLVSVLNLFQMDALNTVSQNVYQNCNLIFLLLASFSIALHFTNNSKKSIIVSASLLLCDLIYFSMTGNHYSMVFIIILSFAYCCLSKSFDFYVSSLALIFISFTISILFGLCHDVLAEMLEYYADLLKSRPVLFGMIEPIYSLFFSDHFSELFLFKGFSQTAYIQDKLVSGAVNIFKADMENPSAVVAEYLTGKYFLNIFVTTGIFVSLYSKFNDYAKTAFCLTAVVCVLFGRFELFLLFIVIFNPALLLGYAFLSFISYLVPKLIDIRIGYIDSASLIGLFRYGNNWIYFIVSGVILSVLSYFVTNMINTRFDLQESKILPKEVRTLVKGLGGRNNIDRIKNDRVYVKNPNLIDILTVDCEIHENEITLLYDDINMLKDYF